MRPTRFEMMNELRSIPGHTEETRHLIDLASGCVANLQCSGRTCWSGVYFSDNTCDGNSLWRSSWKGGLCYAAVSSPFAQKA